MNALVGVEHALFWSGVEVTRILSRFVLSDLTYDSAKPYFKQKFELKWVQQTNSSYPLPDDQLLSVTDYDNFVSSDSFAQTLESTLEGKKLSNHKDEKNNK